MFIDYPPGQPINNERAARQGNLIFGTLGAATLTAAGTGLYYAYQAGKELTPKALQIITSTTGLTPREMAIGAAGAALGTAVTWAATRSREGR